MQKLLFLIVLLSFNASAEMYKWVDEDGNIVYSDTPKEGAEEVKVPELITTPAIKVDKPKKTEDKKPEEQPKPYKKFSIASPENDAIVRDNTGNITLALDIEPALQTQFGHSISYLLDGSVVAKNLKSSSYTYTNIDRGSHNLSAVLKNKQGKTIKTTRPITVHLKRHSILHQKQRSQLWPESSWPKAIGTDQTAL